MKHIDISQTDAPRQKPYAKLRGLLKEYDYTQADIARKLGCGTTYLNNAMNARAVWQLDYCYTILDMFRIKAIGSGTVAPVGDKFLSAVLSIGAKDSGLKTGFLALDTKLRGLKPGHMTVKLLNAA